MIRTCIKGTGHYLPQHVVKNEDLSELLETSDTWISNRTGIRKRHILGEDETTSDMAAAAGREACAAAGIAPQDLDLIVVATVTADMPMPSCAVITQQKLGARCPAFDLSAACAGFSYGLSVVDGLVKSGSYKKVLLIGAEALSRYLDWTDRSTCILFGDGAGAIVVVGEDQPIPAAHPEATGILSTRICADGRFWQDLNIPGGGTQSPPSVESIGGGLHYLKMNGKTIFTQAIRCMSEVLQQVLADVDVSIDQVDLIVPHQANLRIIEGITKRLKVPKEKVMVNLDQYGNTSSASIPIALDEAVRSGRIRPYSTVLLCGLGSGLTWGAALVRW